MEIAARPGDRGQAAVSLSVLRRRSGRTLQAGPHGVKVRNGPVSDAFWRRWIHRPSRSGTVRVVRFPMRAARLRRGTWDDGAARVAARLPGLVRGPGLRIRKDLSGHQRARLRQRRLLRCKPRVPLRPQVLGFALARRRQRVRPVGGVQSHGRDDVLRRLELRQRRAVHRGDGRGPRRRWTVRQLGGVRGVARTARPDVEVLLPVSYGLPASRSRATR